MEDRVKLPMTLGLIIAKKLSSDIKPLKGKKGQIYLEFDKSDLDTIEELVIKNPSRNILSGIEHLTSLKKLVIMTYMDTQYRQNRNIASISSCDINLIESLTSLEELEIINQNGIHIMDLSQLSNLKKLKIVENENLDSLLGIEYIPNLEELVVYENKNLFEIEGLNSIIKQSKLTKLILSLLYFKDVVNCSDNIIDMEVLSKLYTIDECYFVEVPSDLRMIKISPDEALKFHQRCLTLIDSKLPKDSDILGYIISVEEYLTQNVLYDYEALQHDFTHIDEKKLVGPLYGSNSAYNALMFKTATGEGYTRAMVYLLKQLGINAHIVNCNKETDIDYSLHNSFPDDGFHSIVSINDYYNLYCDPLWDAFRFQSGNSYDYLSFTLLNKKEISKTHHLMYDDKCMGSEELSIPRKIIKQYLMQKQDDIKVI